MNVASNAPANVVNTAKVSGGGETNTGNDTASDPTTVLTSPALATVCGRIVEYARGHFVQADRIMERNPRRLVRAPRIMSEAYRLILDRLVARGWSHPRRAIRLPRMRLIWIIIRHAIM